jgi:hypothetical protein
MFVLSAKLLPGGIMFNLHINLAMALAGLRSVVDRFGESHVGTMGDGRGCAYVENVDGLRLVPSCIVGQFFADLGILRVLTVADDAAFVGCKIPGSDLRNQGGMSKELRTTLADKFGVTMTDEAFTFLTTAQFEQDGEYAWGEAVERAAAAILRERGEPQTAVEILALQAEDGDTGKPTGGTF